MLRLFFLLLTLLTAFSATAKEPSLGLPLDCILGQSCWIAKYVDHDRTEARLDYACGQLTGDGHKGTDFAILDQRAMADGVPVLAMADGLVLRGRDGMADLSTRVGGSEGVKGKDCGNGLVIDHGEGWQTQYCHLRKGSITVKANQKVKAGQQLGLVGLSGMTEYPHLHVTVRYRKRVVDPFRGLDSLNLCGLGGRPLWQPEVLKALIYRPVATYHIGFAGTQPEVVAARAGAYRDVSFANGAKSMFFWADIFGPASGDALDLRIVGPDGEVLRKGRQVFNKSFAQWFGWVELQRTGEHWPSGSYRGEVTVTRGKDVVTSASTFTVP